MRLQHTVYKTSFSFAQVPQKALRKSPEHFFSAEAGVAFKEPRYLIVKKFRKTLKNKERTGILFRLKT